MPSSLFYTVLFGAIILRANSKPQYEINNDGNGNSNFRYQLLDGTVREENVQINNQHHVVTGFYSYYDPDGRKYNVRYVADENGFRPEIAVPDDGLVIEPDISSAAIGSLQGGGLG